MEGKFWYLSFFNGRGKLINTVIDTQRYPIINSNLMRSCLDYPISIEEINGKKYFIFKMRETKNIYTGKEKYFGKALEREFSSYL